MSCTPINFPQILLNAIQIMVDVMNSVSTVKAVTTVTAAMVKCSELTAMNVSVSHYDSYSHLVFHIVFPIS